MKTHLIILLALSTLLGCNKYPNGEDSYAYFGGEIINPNNDYVVLNSPDEEADTLLLDESNRFFHKLNNVKPGLYKFVHGGEYQLILLEPKDSILLRLNTIDFDESLVFTGDGARKNNYLISTFLENELYNKKLMRMWEMDPIKFEQVLDLDRKKKLDDLHKFLSQKEYSDLFKTLVESSITYNYYSNKEIYPFGYFGYNNLIHYKDLPEQFYNFRKEVDYNNESLRRLVSYNRFLFSHFNNLALGEYYRTATHNVVFDNQSVVYNLEKLRLMDSLISNEKIKNNLLKHTTIDFISVSTDSAEIKELLNSFLKKSSDETDKKYLMSLVNSVDKLRPGNDLPSVKLFDNNENVVTINSLITKPTVIYFWSSNLPYLLRNSHYKVRTLKSKFPEIEFLAININDDDISHWKNTLNQFNFSSENQYRFKAPKVAMIQLALNSVNKSILVDQHGKIIDANAMLFTSEFEEQLELLLQKKEALK